MTDARRAKIAALSAEKRALLERLTRAKADAIPRRADRTQHPLSFAQQRLWFLDRLAEGDAFYVVPAAMELVGALDVGALGRALSLVVARHEVLRATFHDEGGEAVQRVHPPAPITLVAEAATREEAERLAAEDARTPFDLAKGPLLRVRLLRLAPDRHVLLATMHHIVSDGWSTSILLGEISAAYAGATELPPLAIEHADYAAWQRARLGPEALAEHEAFFRAMLAGAPSLLALPTDRPRPAVQSFAGADVHFAWPPALRDAVVALAKTKGATPFMVLLAAFQVLLGRLAGQRDVVIGASMAGRDRVELERLVGFFVNIVVLRGDVGGDPSFDALLARTKEQVLDAFTHREMPFDRLTLALAPERTLAHAPIFQVNFVLQNAPEAHLSLPGLEVRPFPVHAGSARFDLALSMEESPRGLGGTLTYRTDLWDAPSVARMVEQLRVTLTALVEAPTRPISAIAFPRHAVLVASTAHELVHVRVAALAQATPERVAITRDDVATTYGALEGAAQGIAARLRAGGVRPGTRVAIAAPRVAARVAAIFGVWKVGASFVPIDTANPAARIAAMLEDAGVTVAIADDASAELLPASIARVFPLEDEAGDGPLVEVHVDPDAEAYAIFTSGSTGRPKGVSIHHRGLANLAVAQRRAFGLRPDDRVLQLASFGFDASVSELVIALTEGATLVLDEDRDVARLLAERRITCATLPPSLLREIDAPLPDLRIVISAGEALDAATARRWRSRALFNAYGPTEATVCATIHRVTEADDAIVPIGRAIDGVTVRVLDRVIDDGVTEAPLGGFGEIAIGGVGLGRYLGGAQGGFGGGLFRTGDRGRDRGDGVFELTGRMDEQVKIRGHRVEPEEIAVALRSHPAVEDAAVVLRAVGERDALVAFVVGEPEVAVADLAAHLAARVPPYMIPARFVRADALPKTPAGKIDRAALVVPAAAAEIAEAPATDEERTLAAIWAQVLGVTSVSRHDDFFAIGGDSIASLKIVARARAAGLELGPKDVFAHPTLSALAACARRARRGDDVAAPDRDGDRYALSPVQEGMLFHALFEPGGAAYVSQFTCTLHGPLDRARFSEAWTRVMARHPVLRTSFAWEGLDRPVQIVHPAGALALPLRVLDEGAASEEDVAAADRRRGFDLATAPLFRLTLERLDANRHRLVWTHHHAILDGWSVATVLGEVMHAMTSDAPLPPAVPYRAYIDDLERRPIDLAFWRRMLDGVAEPTPLPLGGPSRPVARTEETATRLSEAETEEVLASLRRHGLTPSTLVTGAWSELLARLSGRDDVVVGVTVAGRPPALVDVPIVGLFINTLPFRYRRRTALAALQSTLSEMREHEHTPLSAIKTSFESIVVYESFPAPAAASGAPVITDVGGAEQTSYPLTVVAAPGPRLELRIAFDVDRFARAAIETLLAQFRALVIAIARAPDRPLAEASHLDPSLRAALLRSFDGPTTAPPSSLVPAMIEAQAPARVALVHGEHRMTYGELRARAAAFAGRLATRGVTPGDRVAIAVERSFALPIALLAVWRAGAVAVLLDPSHPPARLGVALDDASFVVATPATAMRVLAAGRRGARLVTLDAAATEPHDASGPPPARRGPDDEAYVLFTSGSTGRPKGVVVPHRALANYVAWARGIYDASSAPLHGSIAYDLTLTSLLLPLATGGEVVILDERPGTDALAERIRSGPGFGFVKLTPSHLAHLLVTLGERLPPGRALANVLVVGGEALAPELVRDTRRIDPAVRIVNEYGPTEACIGCVAHELHGDDTAIGRPIPNTRALVLDPAGEPCGVGIAGELWLGGACLADGYLGLAEETAARFVLTAHGRLYRTGDRARVREDGALVYLGRDDDQVKIRGVRVELAEVAHVLRAMPGVRDAAVVAERGRLHGFVVGAAPTVVEVRERLPDAFVPADIVAVDTIPRAPSGKADRAALLRMRRPVEHAAYEAPEAGVESALAGIWASVLELPRVSRHDDFFALGGDSILALRVIARAAGDDLVVTPRQIFEQRTLASLAAVAQRRIRVHATQGEGSAPLTPIQRWFFAQAKRNPAHYNQSAMFAWPEVDRDRLFAAFVAVLDHHGITRTRFSGDTQRHGGERWMPRRFAVDLGGCADADLPAAIEAHANEAQRSLDGEVRAALMVMTLGRGRGARVLVVMHHLVVDAVSWRPLLDDLHAAYAGAPLPPVPATFLAWSRLVDAHEFEDERAYWAAQRSPAVLPPPGANAAARRRRVTFEAALILDAAANLGCRVHELLLAALAGAFGRASLTVDVEGHGREVPGAAAMDLSRTIGWFTALYPLRLGWRADASLAANLRGVRDAVRAVPNGGVGYGHLFAHESADVAFNWLGRVDGGVAGADERKGDDEGPDEHRVHAVEVNGFRRDDQIVLEWTYDAPIVDELIGRYRQIVDTCIVHANASPRDAPARDPLVVTLADGPSGTPLFLVHPVGGDVAVYADLARRLDRPVYGIRAEGLEGPEAPLDDLEAMADRYVEAIASVAPRGPWIVGGYSFGALAAVPIAARLARRGAVDIVAIDQTPDEIATDLDDRAIFAQVARDLGVEGDSMEAILEARGAALRPALEVTRRCFRALAGFRAARVDARVFVLRAAASGDAERAAEAWRPFATEVTAAGVPGDHLSVLRAGPELARVLSALLRRV